MTEHQMMQMTERAVLRFNAHDVEGYLEMYDRSVVFHGYSRQRPGIAGLKDYYSQLFKSFPDIRLSIDDMFAVQNKLVFRYTIYGTHKAEYVGAAPSNKLVIAPGVVIHHFKGDKVNETWQMADNYKFMMQIGAIEQPVLKR
jgi:predicted ester cyclase